MKNSLCKLVPLFLVLTFVTECVEPYAPPDVSSPTILVIDGSMNIEGPSKIRLTRTQMLADQNPVKEELGAKVSFEEEEGPSYLLSENGKGNYSLPQQAFNIYKNHRIIVQTTDGKEYVSEFVPVVKSSKIDSVNWVVTPDKGVQLYVNTHDLEHGDRYYLWTYEETWRYVAAFYSRYEWVNRVPTPRAGNVYVCYNTKPSTNILIGSTVKLSEPVIHNFPLLYIAQNSEKVRFKYSIIVRQTALTPEAFDYMFELQKNTENLGTLFDPQPSHLTGNIRCTTNLSEPVLGYFLAGSTDEKRIFISSDILPRAKYYDTYYKDCIDESLIAVSEIPMYSDKALLNILLLESQATPGMGTGFGYSFTNATCGDCRTAGGTIKVPDFWE